MPGEFEAEEPVVADAYADTVRIRVLPESAVPPGANSVPAPSFDPYSTDLRAATPRRPRRTLDDMRRLSEAIVRNRRQSTE
ncbi:MAG TPA: hypothetical protein VMT66_10685 [Steroidobacteraceae bacterium]|nr:hypothetical protein [Steroidobacteraceae bacterium]